MPLTEASLTPPIVETCHVCVHVVQPKQGHQRASGTVNRYDLPVRIRRRLFRVPHRGDWELSVDPTFNFRLVVDTVEADNPL